MADLLYSHMASSIKKFMQLLGLTFLLLMVSTGSYAKIDKVKFSKYLVFEGEVLNDQPAGKGVFNL